MRHRKSFNHLSRQAPHRKAMLANMANSLIEHKRITTTVAKAKALRGFVEPLITKSKTDNTHSRRMVFRYLKDKNAVSELFREVAPKVAERPGGYTRIIKTGFRLGDSAEMCMIELVDYNELYNPNEKQSGAGKKRRRRRKKSSGAATTDAQESQNKTTDESVKQAEAAPAEEQKEASTKPSSEKAEDKKSAQASEAPKPKETKDSKAEDKKEDKKGE